MERYPAAIEEQVVNYWYHTRRPKKPYSINKLFPYSIESWFWFIYEEILERSSLRVLYVLGTISFVLLSCAFFNFFGITFLHTKSRKREAFPNHPKASRQRSLASHHQERILLSYGSKPFQKQQIKIVFQAYLQTLKIQTILRGNNGRRSSKAPNSFELRNLLSKSNTYLKSMLRKTKYAWLFSLRKVNSSGIPYDSV